MSTRALSSVAPPLVTVVLIALLWVAATSGTRIEDYVLPSPGSVVTALRDNWAGRLAPATWLTLTETLLGILCGVAVALVVTVAAGYLPLLGRALTPLLVASQAVPTIVLGPILTIALGYGMLPKVIVVALVCFFPVAMNLLSGIRGVDQRLVDTMRSLHGTRHAVFWRLRFPSALPAGFAGLRVAVTYAPVAAVFSEYTGSTDGVGYLLLQAIPRLQTDYVFALVVVLTVMSATLLLLATMLERLCCPWAAHSPSQSPKGSR
ncbi:ABC transporter permease [Corynebacterium glyciniphilum]|uniref:ABC-type transporter, permease subunit n=1 Tax=Corynebacterium glyciniphilum AJ 3170 TaxID=1404245 RepID=X5E7U3_9CORY|nr:ABC transporter permease [Corynebacterium glyciniphilum]AHW63510.1 ABC-type transporter, permease subunit [Corynebacterium glyciniphilum AJ 3170]